MAAVLTVGETNYNHGDLVSFSESWNQHGVKTLGRLRHADNLWYIDYTDRMVPKTEKVDLNRIEHGHIRLYPYVPPTPLTPPRRPVQTKEEEEKDIKYRMSYLEDKRADYRGGKRTRRSKRKRVKRTKRI